MNQVNNTNNNVSPQHSANIDSIERLLDGKITTLLSNFQSNVNEKITLLSGSVDRIVGDVSGIKVCDFSTKRFGLIISKKLLFLF